MTIRYFLVGPSNGSIDRSRLKTGGKSNEMPDLTDNEKYITVSVPKTFRSHVNTSG